MSNLEHVVLIGAQKQPLIFFLSLFVSGPFILRLKWYTIRANEYNSLD